MSGLIVLKTMILLGGQHDRNGGSVSPEYPIEDELRNQKAEKRRKTKADKALKASQENEKLTNENSQVEVTKPEPELPPENNLLQPEKPEKISYLSQTPRALTVKQRLDLIKKSNSGGTKQPTFLDILTGIVKHYQNRKK